MLEGSYQLGLSDLLDQRDVASFEEMQQLVEDMGRPMS